MHHYIAFTWTHGDSRASLEALRLRQLLEHTTPTWKRVVNADTLAVYAKEAVDPAMCQYVLHENRGVVFGRLFQSGPGVRPVKAADLHLSAPLTDEAERLMRDYWGSYVAILHSPEERKTIVVRDCSGRLPCYYTSTAGLYVFFADICDIGAFSERFTLNSAYLTSYIYRYPLHVRETGLQEVSEVLSGDGVTISRLGIAHRCFWNPRLLCSTPGAGSYVRAEMELREVTEQVVGRWASLHQGILLKLSGGLDSAIVLGCLRRFKHPKSIVCVNSYTEHTNDDERSYARAAAKMAGVRLIELPRSLEAKAFVDALWRIPPAPKPDVPNTMRMAMLADLNGLADRYRCDAIWTGQGGDHVFMQVAIPYLAADYLMQHRVPYGILGPLYDSAILSGHSIWSVIGETLRCMLPVRGVPPDPFDFCGATLMTRDALAGATSRHVAALWHAGPARLPPGKQIQVDLLLDLLNRHKPLPPFERPYESHPLVSQPLLELSLRIPTYHLLRGGRQRAMARAAFKDRVPLCILSREDKGGIMDQTRALIRGSWTLLRENLLEGTLVSRGIVDRASLERLFVTQESYRATEMFALLGCIAVEIWATHWAAHTRQPALVHAGSSAM
jgi:asparagine synthase (glutamine-hydrolysing)